MKQKTQKLQIWPKAPGRCMCRTAKECTGHGSTRECPPLIVLAVLSGAVAAGRAR